MAIRSKKKKEYSTVVIVNRNNPNTKSISIRTKHLTRLKYYILALVLVLSSLITSVVILNKQAQQNAAAKHELEKFKREIAGPMASDTTVARAYIKKIDSKLYRIQKYMKQRGVQRNTAKIGGIEQKSVSGLDQYRFYNVFLDGLIKNLKYLPLGYPHRNHRHSKYGYRSNPFHGGGSEFHSGVDIEGKTGDPVKATANGVVVLADWSYGYGKCVRIRHKHGYETLYGHLSKINVKVGQEIKADHDIGALGSTGRSTGPHLHYEVRYLDRPINPSDFLDLH